MNTREFLKFVKSQAIEKGLSFSVVKNRGKGSHRMAYVGHRKCSIPWNASSIPLGTRRKILKALGIDPRLLR